MATGSTLKARRTCRKRLSIPVSRAADRSDRAGLALGLAVDLSDDEAVWILGNTCEVVLRGFWPEIVRRPALLKRVRVAGQVLPGWPDRFHHMDSARSARSGPS